jgi:hypothetical protein
MPRITASAVLLILGLNTAWLAQTPAGRAEQPSFSLPGASGGIPFLLRYAVLVRMDEVQNDLKLTGAQKQRLTSLMEQHRTRMDRC